METCDICGKECKTAQGLGGHKRWVHGVAPAGPQLRLEQPNPLITKSVLEQLLDERFAVISEQMDALSAEQPGVLSSEQVQQQLKDVDERLKLAEVAHGLTEAERESLASLKRELVDIKTGINKMVQTINSNNKDWGDKVSQLFLYLEAHTHWLGKDDKLATGSLIGPKAEEFNEEVELAKERVGALDAEGAEAEGEPAIIMGKTDLPGYRFLEYLNMSVKES